MRGRRPAGTHREVAPRTGRLARWRAGQGRPARALALALALFLALAACDVAGPRAPRATTASTALQWRPVPLPEGSDPVTLTPAGPGALLIGARASGQPIPRLVVLRDEMLSEVPLAPTSPYAPLAQWFSVAVKGDVVEAVGGARGGAHGNYRWTVWTGTWAGDHPRLVERPQPFDVFGGWGAGDLVGVAFAGTEPVIAGAWQSDRTGNDVSLWRRSGDRWGRLSSTGTPLGSTPEELKGARFVTSTGAGLALVGSVTRLGGGTVASVPALWTAPSAGGPWRLVTLPARDRLAEGHAARCDAGDCVVVGIDGGRLAVWDVHSAQSNRVDVPGRPVSDQQAVPSPVALGGDEFVAISGTVLERTTSGWRDRSAPSGVPTALAAVGDTLYLVTADDQGRTRLWAGQP